MYISFDQKTISLGCTLSLSTRRQVKILLFIRCLSVEIRSLMVSLEKCIRVLATC
jgi:hypothetical protein